MEIEAIQYGMSILAAIRATGKCRPIPPTVAGPAELRLGARYSIEFNQDSFAVPNDKITGHELS